MAQSVKYPTLDFSSGHVLTIMRSSPASGLMLSTQSLLGILSLPLSLPLPQLVLSLSQNKKINRKQKEYLAIPMIMSREAGNT